MLKKPSQKMMDVIIYCSASVLILILLHVFLGRTVVEYSKRLKEEFKQKEVKLRESEALIKSLPDPQKAIDEIEKKAEEFKDMGVTRKQLPRLVQLLGRSTSEQNINVITIKPREDIRSVEENLPAGVFKVYIEMAIGGSFQSLGDYIKVLSALPVTFSIESMTVEKREIFTESRQGKRAGEKTGGSPESEGLFCTLLLSTYTIWEL